MFYRFRDAHTFFGLIRTGNINEIQKYIKKGYNPNKSVRRLYSGMQDFILNNHEHFFPEITSLDVAIINGQTKIALYLLDNGAIPSAGPLYHAIMTGNKECVKSLLQHGIDPNLCHEHYGSFVRLINFSIAYEKPEVEQMLRAAGGVPIHYTKCFRCKGHLVCYKTEEWISRGGHNWDDERLRVMLYRCLQCKITGSEPLEHIGGLPWHSL